jgi:phage/plasmid-like protein (TIGR03299 family)
MKFPEGLNVAGDPREKIETYILLTNSHDGSTSVVIAVVPIRVVCQNTLAYGLRSAIRAAKVRHTESAEQRFVEARRALEIGFNYTAELGQIADEMVNTSFSDEEFTAFLDSLVPTPEPVVRDNKVTNQRSITMALNTKGLITQVYYHNETQENIRDTLWGAVQACQFHADHASIFRQTDSSPDENRFKKLTSGQNLGSNAFTKALELL